MEKYIDIIQKYPKDRSYLLELLREIQVTYGYVPNEAIKIVSKQFEIIEDDVEDMVDFYSMLSREE